MIHNHHVLFVALTSRANADGVPIYCRVTYMSIRKDFATGIRVPASAWDQKKQRIRTKDAQADLKNQQLIQLQHDVNKVVQMLVQKETPFDVSDIVHHVLHPEASKQHTLVEAFEARLAALRKMLGKGIVQETVRHYATSLQNMRRFIQFRFGRKDYPLAKVDVNWLLLYEDYLLTERGQRQVTANKQILRLKNVVRYAHILGWLSSDPFVGHRFKSTQLKVIYLTTPELQQLSEHPFSQERLCRVRDMFLFSVYTGLHYSDAAQLTQKNIVTEKGEDWIVYTRKKTDKEIWVPLLPIASALLQRMSRYTDGTYLLPRISNQKFNSYLKEVADIAGIEKPLTHKIARKTFASTVLIGSGVPMAIVSDLLGHSNVKITQQHYAKVDRSLLAKEMRRISTETQQKVS